uniref:Phosphoglycerate mutase n=1 Tax=viral metagenome TaxID=1070528 RepID=A0A6C0J3E4_9ZZZZ
MKIYILRHEDRTQDATFFSPLTKIGLENSVKLVSKLNELDIDTIYSSPFIRTLQTIHPYLKEKNKKVNIEYCLQEIQHPQLIPPKSYTVSLPVYIAESFNYNDKYRSLIEPENNKYPEDERDVTERAKKILKRIMNDNVSKKNNILLVTHQAVCNAILKIACKGMKEVQVNYTDRYPKGGVTEIWDKDSWKINKINY